MNLPEEYKKTVKSALNMLAYAENTKKGLMKKLQQKGYSQESIEFTLEYVESKRLLNEERYIYRLVETLAKTKGYGEKRIVPELYHKGFSDEVIKNCLDDALASIDFDQICHTLCKRIYDGDREKTFAKLVRHGHGYERAARILKLVEAQADDE